MTDFDTSFHGKVSRIEKNTPFKQNDISIETHLKSTLLETKEYLLNDDLERSVETIIRSSFDEEEIQKWINDIESLIDVKKNLEELEYILLELTGKEID